MADLPVQFFRRIDEADDELFYEFPRKVVHIDDGAIETVGQLYGECLPEGGEILDLMSSWRSHLPRNRAFKRVIGLGLNRAEMEDNPALTGYVIHNVNRDPRLPFDDGSFDAAVMTVSVQYLTRPIEVFAETGRVLREGGLFIVTFSNRMFPTKAIELWQVANDSQRLEIVKRYFAESGAFERVEACDRSRRPGPPPDPIWAVAGRRSGSAARRP